MYKFTQTAFVFVVLLSISACGGGGGSSSSSEDGVIDYGPLIDFTDYNEAMNATDLIASTDSSTVSIGIFDFGFSSAHIELADRFVIQQNYDDTLLNSLIEDGTYTYINDTAWEWANHGTATASLALGQYIGMARKAEAVTAMNRSLSGAFDATDYFASFTKNAAGIISGEGVCVQYIQSAPWYPWCISFESFHIKKLQQAASYDMPAVNVSSTIPFGHFQVGIDLSFDQASWDDGSYVDDWNLARTSGFTNLYMYDYKNSYDHLRGLLADGDLVIVNSAGNDGESLTQRQVLPWQYLLATSLNRLADTIINVFFDPDIDSNRNGVIENSERGITGGLLYVGALDENGDIAWYSNRPGRSAEVQARFIVAPGENKVATPSYGTEGYAWDAGTSYAAPVVSGAIALLKVKHPSKSARQIANAILATASKNIPNYAPFTHGQGLLNVAAAEAYLQVN